MVILGIIDSKPSTAAIIIDGRIISAISEERLCRMKMAWGMPREAIKSVMEIAGVSPTDIDHVAIGQQTMIFRPEPMPWSGWFQDEQSASKKLFTDLSATLAPIIGSSQVSWQAHHRLKRFLLRDRYKKIPALLQSEYGIQAPIKHFDHHYCHATGAYFTSNFDRALVFTLDGGGDGLSGSVYLGEGGNLRRISSVDSYNSLGNFYSYITAICGFKAERHEGKITGLAALGEPIYADILRHFICYQDPGQIRYTVPMYHNSAVKRLSEQLPDIVDNAALAASIQLILEEIGIDFVKYWLKQTGIRNVAVAGGVFANVKFNQRIHELEEVDKFFVHPAMDDSGLAVGGALAAYFEQNESDPKSMVHHLTNVYLGPEFSEGEIDKAVHSAGVQSYYQDNIQETVAGLLAKGHVVARFTGRMEYGPRALGHRSILYQTTDPSVNNWLNERLKRTEFMPFAPATLVEHTTECYENVSGAEDPARFMTITFDCTPTMKSTSPGVIHVDGTARPQLIDQETAPDFYKILTEYHRLTGIPSLINTSFNLHEEPIVCTPDDAMRSFQQGNLDYLAIGNWLVAHPEISEMQSTTQTSVQLDK